MIRTIILAIFLGPLLSACSLGGGSGGATTANPTIIWSRKSSMAIPRTEFGVATVNDKIYAIGGYSGLVLRSVEEYDPTLDTWTARANMPTARRLLIVAAVNNKIYAIGGMDYTNPNNVSYRNETEAYDPATNTWSVKAPLPLGPAYNSVLGNRFMGGASANGKIYVVVFDTDVTLTKTFEYDPAADTWSSKAPVPFANTHFAVASSGGKIYALADGERGYPFLGEYDPLKDIWVIRPPIMTYRSFAGLTSVGGKLYAAGGAADNVVNTIEEYDPITHNWALRTSMSVARCFPAVGEIRGKIYVIGGSANRDIFAPSPLTTVEEGTPPSPDSVLAVPAYLGIATSDASVTVSWSSVTGASYYNVYMSTNPALDKDTFEAKYTSMSSPYVITGLMNNQTYYFFVTAANEARESEEGAYISATPAASPDLSWKSRPPLTMPRLEAGVATFNGTLYVIGGYSGSTLRTTESFNPDDGTWISHADMPTPRRGPVVVSINNNIYAIGGADYTNPNQVSYSFANEVYDPSTDAWTSKAAMPVGPPVNSILGNRYIGGAAANGKIYVVVFTPGNNYTYEYDPILDTWNPKAPVPIGALGTPYAAASLNGKIYVLAGYHFAEYNPSTDIWIIKADLPDHRQLAGLVSVPFKNKLYAVGGYALGSITEYDPIANAWTPKAPMPSPRNSAGIGEVNGSIYVIGGSESGSNSPLPNDSVEVGF